MSHSVAYTIGATAFCCFAWIGGPVAPSVAVLLAALAIAFIGVPHGGLDHWVGRRLLSPRFGRLWPLVFLPAYFSLGVLFIVAWFVVPLPTIVFFFLLSAWHFGREDGLNHLEAVAAGGLIIWVPALARPAEMETILKLLIVDESASAAATVVGVTQVLAAVLLPIAIWSVTSRGGRRHRLVALATATLAVATPILCSFTLFFCGWHSIRGLARMRNEVNLTWSSFVYAVSPLSVGAVALVIGVGLFWTQPLAEPTTQTRMLFIGLASIAVPHLFLHEIESRLTLEQSPEHANEVAHVA